MRTNQPIAKAFDQSEASDFFVTDNYKERRGQRRRNCVVVGCYQVWGEIETLLQTGTTATWASEQVRKLPYPLRSELVSLEPAGRSRYKCLSTSTALWRCPLARWCWPLPLPWSRSSGWSRPMARGQSLGSRQSGRGILQTRMDCFFI